VLAVSPETVTKLPVPLKTHFAIPALCVMLLPPPKFAFAEGEATPFTGV
jgi:hypothetical protein